MKIKRQYRKLDEARGNVKFMIKNRESLVKELASMLNDIDCSFNKFYTDIYAYVHEDGSVTLRDYANVGGNSWLEDEHYTIYTCSPNYSSPIDFFVTSEEIANALNMSVADLENETRDYYNMSDFDDVSYYEICSMVSDTYADEIEKAYLNEYSDYREYLDQANDIISEFEKRLEMEKYENGLDEKMNSRKFRLVESGEISLRSIRNGLYEQIERDVEKYHLQEKLEEALTEVLMEFMAQYPATSYEGKVEGYDTRWQIRDYNWSDLMVEAQNKAIQFVKNVPAYYMTDLLHNADI